MAWEIPASAAPVRVRTKELTWGSISFPIESIALVQRAAGSADDWQAVGQAVLGDAEKAKMAQDFRAFVDWLLGAINAGLRSAFGNQPAVDTKDAQSLAVDPRDAQSLAAWLVANTAIGVGADGVPQVRLK